ncbi:MAG: phosphatidylcholine/phosphatidylserine synthase [Proteobacteria bacterium]|nr:phosphatidylcholine/phosphatidylserine synthase [Pseudomonadota bacterium]
MSKTKKIKKARFALPSLVTLGSVFCAFLSIAFVFKSQGVTGDENLKYLMYGALAIIGSIIFDTFDGKVARLTHTSTKFGMELDSLADGVSFGFAPAVLIYGFALHNAGIFGLIASFIFAAGALLRLARFNIEAPDEGVQTYFKGIPAPGGASCIAAIVIAAIHSDFTLTTDFELNTLAFIVIAVGLLMVSTVKYKTLKGKKTKGDYIYLVLGIGMFVALCFIKHPAIAFFFLVCYFVLFGMLNTIYLNLKYSHRRRRHQSVRSEDGDAESSQRKDNAGDTQDKKDASEKAAENAPETPETERQDPDAK